MKKLTLAALIASAFVFASVPAVASVDQEQIEEECREAALAEEVATDEMADYIAECVAATAAAEEEGEGKEKDD